VSGVATCVWRGVGSRDMCPEWRRLTNLHGIDGHPDMAVDVARASLVACAA
jgi:hypothetical protein